MQYKIKQNKKTKGEKTQVIHESKVQFIWQNLPLEKSLPFHICKHLYLLLQSPSKQKFNMQC